jgi:hypothetical protein
LTLLTLSCLGTAWAAAPAGAATTGIAVPATSSDSGCPSYDDPNENPAVKAALDVVAPEPAFNDGAFSDCDRIAGLLGFNEDPGGPLGWWPRPANPDGSAEYGAFPGAGPYGQVSDITGINPRAPYAPRGDKPAPAHLFTAPTCTTHDGPCALYALSLLPIPGPDSGNYQGGQDPQPGTAGAGRPDAQNAPRRLGSRPAARRFPPRWPPILRFTTSIPRATSEPGDRCARADAAGG